MRGTVPSLVLSVAKEERRTWRTKFGVGFRIPTGRGRLRPCAYAPMRTQSLAGNNAWRYYSSMIRSFADRDTERLFRRELVRRLPAELRRGMLRKLLLLDAAESIVDLRVPPGNRLERLKGDRAGQHGIRINDQWRICFVWRDGDAHDVEITDYH